MYLSASFIRLSKDMHGSDSFRPNLDGSFPHVSQVSRSDMSVGMQLLYPSGVEKPMGHLAFAGKGIPVRAKSDPENTKIICFI